jgi:hypothetical protein
MTRFPIVGVVSMGFWKESLPPPSMFLRFVTTRLDEDSHVAQGVFVAAYGLLDSGQLSTEEWRHVREILNWFNEHLPHPPDSFPGGRAIFWFRSAARESIQRIWDLVAVLREHDHHVEVHKCRRLANIRYRDEFQVAAYPSDRDGRILIQ